MSLARQHTLIHTLLEEISLIKEDQRTPLVQHWNKTAIEAIHNKYVDANQLKQFNEHKVFISLFPRSVIEQREYQQKIHLSPDDVELLRETYDTLTEKMENLNDHDNEDIYDNNRFWKTGDRGISRQTKIDHDLHKLQCDAYILSVVEPTTNKKDVDTLQSIEDDTNQNACFAANNIQVQQIEEETDNDLDLITPYNISENAETFPQKQITPFQNKYAIEQSDDTAIDHKSDDTTNIVDETDVYHERELDEIWQYASVDIVNTLKQQQLKCEEKDDIIIVKCKSSLSATAQEFRSEKGNNISKPLITINEHKPILNGNDDDNKALEIIIVGCIHYMNAKLSADKQLDINVYMDWLRNNQMNISYFNKKKGQKLDFAKKLRKDLSLPIAHGQTLYDNICIAGRVLTFDCLQQRCTERVSTADSIRSKLLKERAYLQQTVDALKQRMINQQKTIESKLEYIKMIEGINNYYFVQCLKPYPSQIVPHPIHQKVYAPLIAIPMNASCYIHEPQPQYQYNECKYLQIKNTTNRNNRNNSNSDYKANPTHSNKKRKTFGAHRQYVDKDDGNNQKKNRNNLKSKKKITIIESRNSTSVFETINVHQNNVSSNENKDDVEQNQNRNYGNTIDNKTNDDKKSVCSRHIAKDKHSDKVLLVLRGLLGCCKMEWAHKLQRRNGNTVVFNDWQMEECSVAAELIHFVRFKEFINISNGKCIILLNDDPRIASYERLIKYAVRHGYIFGRIIEFFHNESLINVFRSRTDRNMSYDEYVFLLKTWERDPRAELIYSCQEDKQYDLGY